MGVGRKVGRWALLGVLGLVSAALAALAFLRPSFTGGFHVTARFDFGDWLRQLPSHLRWVIPFMVLTATLSALRALVWGKTLPEGGPDPGWRARFHAFAVGALVHNGVPGHLRVAAPAWGLHPGGGPPLPRVRAPPQLAACR